jgi:predicted nucleic acid-binding protein
VSRPVIVMDASVGVKWFRDEAGSAEALELLRRLGAHELQLVVPVIFLHEVLDVARRTAGIERARELWESLEHDGIVVVGADPSFVEAMLAMCERLGCSLHDAAAPVLAEMLDAELVSADRRAHDSLPNVRIVG